MKTVLLIVASAFLLLGSLLSGITAKGNFKDAAKLDHARESAVSAMVAKGVSSTTAEAEIAAQVPNAPQPAIRRGGIANGVVAGLALVALATLFMRRRAALLMGCGVAVLAAATIFLQVGEAPRIISAAAAILVALGVGALLARGRLGARTELLPAAG